MSRAYINQFRAWLRTQRRRDDPVGDFARDFLNDKCAGDVSTLSGLDNHLRDEHDADPAAIAARDRAWREWTGAPPAPMRLSLRADEDATITAELAVETMGDRLVIRRVRDERDLLGVILEATGRLQVTTWDDAGDVRQAFLIEEED